MTFSSSIYLFTCIFAVALAADDWVLHVPGGHETASLVAKQHHLDNLGEVIPETNLFHFKQSATRSKRSLGDLKDMFEANPLVAAHHVQDKSLSRSKRVPIPQAELGRSTGNQLCFINTIATDKKDAKRCIFPFSYRGKTYIDCTDDHSSNGAEWCATQVDSDGVVVTSQWGDCDKKSLSCLTIGAGSLGKPAAEKEERRPAAPAPPRRPPAAPQQPFGPPPNFQQQGGNFQQGGFPGFPFPPPRGFPPQSANQRNNFPPPPPRGQSANQAPARSFPPPQFSPNGNQPTGPSAKSAVPPQFQFDPSFILGLANKLAGGGGPIGDGKPGSQKEEETFPEVDRSQFKTNLNDEAWPAMWYLNRGGRGMDMNVEDAWEQGYSGKGVVVTILDDGVETDHPDLKDNYDKAASIDLNDNDDDPNPRYDFINSNKHGTRCAGTVAASANNSDCAVGIAFDAKIGGVRILDGNILDVLEARAISFNRDYVDIYSASWGPDDDGKTVDGPGPLAKKALEDGVNKGRDGKGSIFVWASGNGGKYLDNCNADGYTTSIYTLSVSSVSELGLIPWYSEPCSSSLTTTYSSGSSKQLGERKVVTTDLHGRCTSQHTGTSASSPMAAGIVALALEANPDLTWRDVQHVIVRTSIPRGHLQAEDWATNGAGLEFSHSYGFGLMDAGAITKLAKDWVQVPDQLICTTEPGQSGVTKNRPVLVKGQTEQTVILNASNCDDINFIEHLHIKIDLTSGAKRGDLSVVLRSPSGTASTLLAPRPFDSIRSGFGGFSEWPMMSVHFWGESVASSDLGGEWSLTISNLGDKPCILNDWQLVFYGTNSDPQPGVPLRPTEETPLVVDVGEDETEQVDNADEILDDDDIVEEEAEDTTPFEENFDNPPEKLEILNDRE